MSTKSGCTLHSVAAWMGPTDGVDIFGERKLQSQGKKIIYLQDGALHSISQINLGSHVKMYFTVIYLYFSNMQYYNLHSGYEYKIWQPGTLVTLKFNCLCAQRFQAVKICFQLQKHLHTKLSVFKIINLSFVCLSDS
jgi:hypothetical protein